jgi:hypothetical protein
MSEKNAEPMLKVKYTRSDIRGLGPDVRLYPCDPDAKVNTEKIRAYNLIPASALRAFEKHPQIRGLVADGSIVVLGEEKSEPAPVAERRTRKKSEPASATASDEPPALPEGREAANVLKSLGLT